MPGGGVGGGGASPGFACLSRFAPAATSAHGRVVAAADGRDHLVASIGRGLRCALRFAGPRALLVGRLDVRPVDADGGEMSHGRGDARARRRSTLVLGVRQHDVRFGLGQRAARAAGLARERAGEVEHRVRDPVMLLQRGAGLLDVRVLEVVEPMRVRRAAAAVFRDGPPRDVVDGRFPDDELLRERAHVGGQLVEELGVLRAREIVIEAERDHALGAPADDVVVARAVEREGAARGRVAFEGVHPLAAREVKAAHRDDEVDEPHALDPRGPLHRWRWRRRRPRRRGRLHLARRLGLDVWRLGEARAARPEHVAARDALLKRDEQHVAARRREQRARELTAAPEEPFHAVPDAAVGDGDAHGPALRPDRHLVADRASPERSLVGLLRHHERRTLGREVVADERVDVDRRPLARLRRRLVSRHEPRAARRRDEERGRADGDDLAPRAARLRLVPACRARVGLQHLEGAGARGARAIEADGPAARIAVHRDEQRAVVEQRRARRAGALHLAEDARRLVERTRRAVLDHEIDPHGSAYDVEAAVRRRLERRDPLHPLGRRLVAAGAPSREPGRGRGRPDEHLAAVEQRELRDRAGERRRLAVLLPAARGDGPPRQRVAERRERVVRGDDDLLVAAGEQGLVAVAAYRRARPPERRDDAPVRERRRLARRREALSTQRLGCKSWLGFVDVGRHRDARVPFAEHVAPRDATRIRDEQRVAAG
jgi:hypothetical protein